MVWKGHLKGADRSVESMAVEVRCALLTLSFLRPTPPMRDVDRKPYKQSGNVRLCHSGCRLLERDNWMPGETPTASTRKRRELRAGHIAWTSRMREKASVSPITSFEKIDCLRVQPARRCQSSSPVITFFRHCTPVEDEECSDIWIQFI